MTSARATATRCCSPPDSMPGPVRQPLAQADPPQQLLGPRARLGRRQPGDPHRHLGVLERAELGQQVVELEHEADVPVPERHQRVVGQRR